MIPWKDDNPRRTFPYITLALVAVNLGLFAWSRFFSGRYEAILHDWGFIPALWSGHATKGLSQPCPALTPLTSLFLHGGILHTVGNLWFLWVFGDNVEDEHSHGRYLAFYLITGLFAVFSHYLSAPASDSPLVGASGAVSGVLAAYVFYRPLARIHSLVPVIFILVRVEIPAFVFIGIWALIQVLGQLQIQTGGIAYAAHIGGFMAGLGLAPLFWKRRRR